MTAKVIIADDHKIMRDGIKSMLEKQRDIETIAEATDGRTTVELAIKLKPDVIIIDVAIPDINGI